MSQDEGIVLQTDGGVATGRIDMLEAAQPVQDGGARVQTIGYGAETGSMGGVHLGRDTWGWGGRFDGRTGLDEASLAALAAGEYDIAGSADEL